MLARKFLAVFVLCLTFLSPALSFADDARDAAAFADQLGHNALAIISGNTSKDDKQAKLEKLFSDNFDIDWIARFVLGRYWKTATPDQQQNYIASYRTFIIKHYTSNLSDFTDTNFEIAKVRPSDSGGNVVTIRIKRPQADDILAEYTIRAKPGEGLKVYDIVIEGVSMITTQRSEFSSVVSQKGIDYLISQLKIRSRNDQGVVKEGQ
jgi:phospholipid transport system substrate-binding protein